MKKSEWEKLDLCQKWYWRHLQIGGEVKIDYWLRDESVYEGLKGTVLSHTKDGKILVDWGEKGVVAMDGKDLQRYSKWAFDNETVKEIRKLYSSGKYTQKKLAEIYDCSASTISKVIHKYEHVDKN